MWRGSALSGLAHGALFVVLLFGLPSFPEIFDRRLQAGDSDLPISVEVVSSEAVDLREPVLAPEKSASSPAKSAASGTRVAPLILGDRAAPPNRDGGPAAALNGTAGTPSKLGKTGSETVRLPTGKLESDRLKQAQASLLDRERDSGERSPSRSGRDARTPSVPKPAQTADRPAEAGASAARTGTGIDASQESARETAQNSAEGRPASGGRLDAGPPRTPSEAAAGRDGFARLAVSRGPPAPGTRGQAARQPAAAQTGQNGATGPGTMDPAPPRAAPLRAAEGIPAMPAQPDRAARPVTPSAGPKAAAAETATDARSAVEAKAGTGAADFLTAVSGRQRDLVMQLLAEDRRLREAIVPPPTKTSVPEQARARTIERLQKAAADGFAHAQFNLASKYLQGRDVPRDPDQAQKWLTKAAEQGYAPAQVLVGLMRFTGVGLPRDLSEASFWWSLAADRGHDGAKLGSELLQPFLKPDDVVKASRLRAQWGSMIKDLSESADLGSNIREINRDLQNAAEDGDTATVLAMLAHGADADSAGKDGRTAVINAAWRGRSEVVRILLQRGAGTELSDDEARTPLLWAAINGHADVAAELIRNGANPNHRDSAGTTALIRAAWNGRTDVVRMLIKAGANLNIRDNTGKTAVAHAREEGYGAIVTLLAEAGAR